MCRVRELSLLNSVLMKLISDDGIYLVENETRTFRLPNTSRRYLSVFWTLSSDLLREAVRFLLGSMLAKRLAVTQAKEEVNFLSRLPYGLLPSVLFSAALVALPPSSLSPPLGFASFTARV